MARAEGFEFEHDVGHMVRLKNPRGESEQEEENGDAHGPGTVGFSRAEVDKCQDDSAAKKNKGDERLNDGVDFGELLVPPVAGHGKVDGPAAEHSGFDVNFFPGAVGKEPSQAVR